MNHLEARLLVAEATIRAMGQQLSELAQRIAKLEQLPWLATQQPGGGSSSSGSGYYCTTPSSGTWGATWSAGVPTAAGSFIATVYSTTGTSITSVGSKTVRNWFPATPVNSLVIQVFPDSSGAFQTGPQSCS